MQTKDEARTLIKAINRWIRRYGVFGGYNAYGVDWVTWRITYPQIADAYQQAAEIFVGRKGRFLPRFK